MAGIRLLGVILVCFGACGIGRCEGGRHELQPCAEVRSVFIDRSIGPGNMVPKQKMHDTDMDICYHGKTHPNKKSCCTRPMEHKYHQAMERDFRDAIQSTSAYLKNLIQLSSQHYQDKFVEMIRQAENNTDTMFAKVYKIPLRERWGAIENLFLNLKSYISKLNETISIKDSTEQFFNEIFPLVFKHNLNSLGEVELSEDYRLCLMETRKHLHKQPFGQYANKLTHDLSKSLGSARDMLQGLSLAVEVINVTDNYKLEHRCSKALTRLTFCSQCQDLTSVRPCKEYCHNVMRGCLADLSLLDPVWNSFADTLDTLTSNMRGSYNIENVMKSFHAQVSDALLNSLDVGPDFYPEIVKKCGKPQGQAKDSTTIPAPQKPNTALFKPTWPAQTPGLHTKLSMFMRTLVSSKGFYSSLPDTLCTAEKFSAGAQKQCWNGDGQGIYNKTVVAFNLVDQRASNPEFRVDTQTPEVIVALKDKLVKMTEQLNNRITSEMTYQADDWAAGGYDTQQGSSRDQDDQAGDPYRRYYGHYDSSYTYSSGYYGTDDEDYNFSGSGSGQDGSQERTHIRTGPKRHDAGRGQDADWSFTENSPYVTQRPGGGANSKQGGNDIDGGAGAATSSSVVFFTLTVLSILMWRGA